MFTKGQSRASLPAVPQMGKGIAPGLKVIADAMKKPSPTFKNANLVKGKKKMTMPSMTK